MNKLLKYNYLANQRFIAFLRQHPFEDGQLLFSHVLNAQQIWNDRIVGNTIAAKPWQIIEPEMWDSVNTVNYSKSMDIIVGIDLSKQIRYTNNQKTQLSNSIQEIMQHVVTHSSYHRGQIAAKAAQLGLKPPATDYILFARGEW